MSLEDLLALVSVKGVGHTAPAMVSTGKTLKASVEEAGLLPGRHRGVWKPYFVAHDGLEVAATRREMREDEDPKVAQAAERIRMGLRVLGDTVHNSTLSLVPEEVEAAEQVQPAMPADYSLVTKDREHWIGKVELLTNILRNHHKDDLKTIGAWNKLTALERALADYAYVYGVSPYRQGIPDDENLAIHLLNCRQALRMVILRLIVIASDNPALAGQIERMLQPYLNLVQRKQARKKKSTEEEEVVVAQGGDGSSEDADNDEQAEEAHAEAS